MRGQTLQRPEQIAVVVGREAQFRARCHHARQPIQHVHLDETALVMARLGPGIGKQNEHARETGIGQRRDHIARIFGVEAEVGEILVRNARQQFCLARDIGLDSDDADMGMGFGLPGQMLAGAEADLEPNFFCPTGKIGAGRAPLLGDERELRQQIFDETRLVRAETRPLAAAVELAPVRKLRRRL